MASKQVFIMNVAGDLRPDQLIYLSGVFGIPSFNPGLGKTLSKGGLHSASCSGRIRDQERL